MTEEDRTANSPGSWFTVDVKASEKIAQELLTHLALLERNNEILTKLRKQHPELFI